MVVCFLIILLSNSHILHFSVNFSLNLVLLQLIPKTNSLLIMNLIFKERKKVENGMK